MNREQELLKIFKAYKGMTITLNKLSNIYVNEDSLSLEDQLLYEAMFRELGWDNKEDFLNGVGEQKVITINVPEEEEHKYKITIEWNNVNWFLDRLKDLKLLDFNKYREWEYFEASKEEE